MELRTLFLLLCFVLIQKFASAALGIVQDATMQGYYRWSAAHAFNEDPATIRNALPALARQAYEEMMVDIANRNLPKKKTPKTMAAFAVGSHVYFSSSVRGKHFLINPNEIPYTVEPSVPKELKLAMIRCQTAYKDETHRYDGACAEPSAIHTYLVNNPDIPITGKGSVSTYGKLDKTNPAIVGIYDPCDLREGKWGCEILLDELGITAIGNQNDQPALPSIEPARALPHCFWAPDPK